MYIFPQQPKPNEASEWISRSLRVGDCFDILLHNKSQQCQDVIAMLRQYGICLSDREIYILLQFDTAMLWNAGTFLDKNNVPILDHIFRSFGSQFPMHLFTSSGSLYALLCFTPPLQGPLLHRKLELCADELEAKFPQRPVHLVVSQNEFGVQGIFHAANSLRFGVDYLRFFHSYPKITFLQLARQTAVGDGNAYSHYAEQAAALSESMSDSDFDPRAAAGKILSMYQRYSACSIESLHRQMQTFSVSFLQYLVDKAVIDRLFLMQHKIAGRIMHGDNEEAYLDNLSETLTLLHQRRLEIMRRYNTQHLSQVYHYVEQNISSMDLSVSAIADQFHVNRSQLTAQFREYYGKSLSEFIQDQRLSHAKLLMLSHPNRSLEDISRDAGYCSLSTMYRAFQKHGLESPAQYRIHHLGRQGAPAR